MDRNTCEILITSLVFSHMDNASSILTGVTESVISKLQLVQNWVAKLVLIRTKVEQFHPGFEGSALIAYIT